MPEEGIRKPRARDAAREWWKAELAKHGFPTAFYHFMVLLYEFARDSTPWHRRRRYGDVGYDWDYRVDTTSATVGWHDRLLGLWHSPYQPTEPALFREMLDHLPIDFREFTFIDIGSGKGRALLMAAEYPFRRIVGIELLPELHRVSQDNLSKYKSGSQQCFALESLCGDAREFDFPSEPIVVYLFNPLPEAGLVKMLENLEPAPGGRPRPVYVLYHNPLLEPVLAKVGWLKRIAGTEQYSVWAGGGAANY